jgi:hypothetical protein
MLYLTENQRLVALYTSMFLLSLIGALLARLTLGAFLLVTGIGFPLVVASFAGRKPILYGVLTNVAQCSWLGFAALLDRWGLHTLEFVGFYFLGVGFMALLAVMSCSLFHFVWWFTESDKNPDTDARPDHKRDIEPTGGQEDPKQ